MSAGRATATRELATARRVRAGARLTRPGAVTAALLVLGLVLGIVALGLGDYPLTPAGVVAAMADPGSFAHTVVLEWRLPRVVLALVLGAALGISGALFQSLTANPLGSPDVIGFSTGAYTGAILAITTFGLGLAGATAGALVGGLLTALVVYLLAYRNGLLGFRLIIVGIGVTAMLAALNTWLLLRAQVEVAMSAAIWGAGSLGLVGPADARVGAAAVAALAVAVALLARPLRQLELGDDAARAHGVRTERVRLGVLMVGVALVAVSTAIAGPIAFVALTAPQIAARLVRGAGLPLVAAGATGGVLLLVADLVAQHALPTAVPVGVVTVVVGGGYLIWLLAREARRRLT